MQNPSRKWVKQGRLLHVKNNYNLILFWKSDVLHVKNKYNLIAPKIPAEIRLYLFLTSKTSDFKNKNRLYLFLTCKNYLEIHEFLDSLHVKNNYNLILFLKSDVLDVKNEYNLISAGILGCN